MRVVGILLTGGASSRLGQDKALAEVDGRRLVDIAAGLVAAASATAIEVGPGLSELPAVSEDPAGQGPLTAFVAGGRALLARGNQLPLLLLGVDMPFVTLELLRLLTSCAGDIEAVVPEVGGEAQPLCAVYPVAALDVADALLRDGERSMKALLAAIPVRRLRAAEWASVAPPDAFDDIDTPADLLELNARAASRPPGL